MHNSKEIWQLSNKLWVNKISQELSLRHISDGYSILIKASDFHKKFLQGFSGPNSWKRMTVSLQVLISIFQPHICIVIAYHPVGDNPLPVQFMIIIDLPLGHKGAYVKSLYIATYWWVNARCNSIANTLELCLSCTNPSIKFSFSVGLIWWIWIY